MSFIEAREKWMAMSRAERIELIKRVHGDEAEAVNDWAGLPPQAQTAIIATLFPPGAGAAEDDDEPHRGRRGR
jgi:hypothetical protein